MTDWQQRFEYKIVRAKGLRTRAGVREQENLLNRLAADGWELVSTRYSYIWDWPSDDFLVLRRALHP